LNAFIDGASRGNPGPAAVGVVLRDERGRLVKEHCRRIGTDTNNVAEYSAMIEALRLAAGLGAKELRVHSDSELLVRQINGQYRIKAERLRELFSEIQGLRRNFDAFEVVHVPREKNADADRLANKALDEAPGAAPNGRGEGQLDMFARPADLRAAGGSPSRPLDGGEELPNSIGHGARRKAGQPG
jgi:ribonuclease HI